MVAALTPRRGIKWRGICVGAAHASSATSSPQSCVVTERATRESSSGCKKMPMSNRTPSRTSPLLCAPSLPERVRVKHHICLQGFVVLTKPRQMWAPAQEVVGGQGGLLIWKNWTGKMGSAYKAVTFKMKAYKKKSCLYYSNGWETKYLLN